MYVFVQNVLLVVFKNEILRPRLKLSDRSKHMVGLNVEMRFIKLRTTTDFWMKHERSYETDTLTVADLQNRRY